MIRSVVKYQLTFLITVLCFFSYPQNTEIDSLIRLLKSCKEDTNKIDLLYELSKLQCFDLQNVAALKSAKMAESLSKKMHYKSGLAKAYHAIGNVYIQEGDNASALEYHMKAMRIKEELNDKLGLAASYNNLGKIYSLVGNYERSMEYYYKSLNLKKSLLKIAEEGKNEKEIKRALLAVVSSSSSIGVNLSDMGKHSKAIEYFNGALAIHEKYDNPSGVAGCYENIGVCYYYMGAYKKALECFTKTYSIRDKIYDKTHLVGTNLNLGKTYLQLGNVNQARKFLNESLKLSTEVRMTDVTRDTYLGLYELELKLNDPEKALRFYKRYIKYRDSISNESVTKRMTRLQLGYEFEKKEKETQLEQEKKDAIASEKSEFQKIIISSISVLMAIMCAFGIYAAINYRQKQKINKTMGIQKEIIEEKQKEIIASINYAKRIQNILLTPHHYIDKELNRLNKS